MHGRASTSMICASALCDTLPHPTTPTFYVQCIAGCRRCDSAEECIDCDSASFKDPASGKCVQVRSRLICTDRCGPAAL